MKQNLFRTTASILGVGIVLGAFAPACGSQVSTLCSAVCDCQHCNDYVDEQTCDALHGLQDVAKDYGCDAEFTAWVTCQNNNGVCNEQKASFSSSTPGSCNGQQDTKFACTTDANCQQFGNNATCVTLTCRTKVCAGSQQNCQTDSDCPTGPDKCKAENDALSSCETNASGNKRPLKP